MRRWTVLLVALLALGCAAPAANAAPRGEVAATKKAAKKKRCTPRKKRAARKRSAKKPSAGAALAGGVTAFARAARAGRPSPPHSARAKPRRAVKRRKARKRCVRPRRHATKPRAPGAAAPGSPATGTPAPGSPAPPADPGTTPDDPGPALPDDPAGGGRSLQVQSGEYYLRLSRSSVFSGDVRVEFDNSRGEDPHDLKLMNAAGDVVGFDEQPSGAITAETFRLGKGNWTLFCALQDHAARGMSASLKVTDG